MFYIYINIKIVHMGIRTGWSPANDFKLPDGSVYRLIAPFGDMLNHSPDIATCHIYDETKRELRVIAGRDYKANEQVYVLFCQMYCKKSFFFLIKMDFLSYT